MTGKIGVFCPTLNVYGGGEFVAIAIANTLAQNNHDVCSFPAPKSTPKPSKTTSEKPSTPKSKPSSNPQTSPRGD